MPVAVIATTPAPAEDRYLDDQEAAAILGLSRSYLRKLRVTGGGPQYRALAPRAIRYRIADLHAWADGHIELSTSERAAA